MEDHEVHINTLLRSFVFGLHPATDPVCIICADPTVRTYDGTFLLITDAQKTQISNWNLDIEDGCKFWVRGVTSFTYFMDSLMEPLWLDWIGIGLAVHNNPTKSRNNWILAQHTDKIAIRGIGYSGDEILDLNEGPANNSQFYPQLGENITEWARQPSCNPLYTAIQTNNSIQVRSYCCGWALNWYPAVRSTCLEVFIQEGSMYPGNMIGICGDANGDPINDWEGCDGNGTVGAFDYISDNCAQGLHDGAAGGTRIV